jgi:hypothetical protein
MEIPKEGKVESQTPNARGTKRYRRGERGQP